jgi:hypothetical protein
VRNSTTGILLSAYTKIILPNAVIVGVSFISGTPLEYTSTMKKHKFNLPGLDYFDMFVIWLAVMVASLAAIGIITCLTTIR